MNNRISTGMLYQQSIGTLQSRQATMAKLQQQLASGQKLTTAKDDPVGAGSAVGLDRTLAELERFGANSNTVRHRLNTQENALAQAGEVMGRLQVLTVQANNGALAEGDRRAIAAEVRSLRDALFDIANTADGTGRYLFGGNQDGAPPFARAAGGVAYSGDQTQRRVEIAPSMFAADALPGSEIFLRVRTGDGRVDAAAVAGNTGSGQVAGFGVTDAEQWNGGRYRVVFAADGAYDIHDADGVAVASGTFVPGEPINVNGLRISITGAPAAGDAFDIGPAGTRDVFATIDNLLQGLTMPASTDAQRATQQETLRSALRDIAAAEAHMIDARAAGGAQLAALEQADELRASFGVTVQETLFGLRDLDYADAITRFNLEKVAIEAAQLSFVQMQRLSLFNLIR
ncbi:flagellar hook-associated protein 3 [Lysobacteraceae bacterium NML91-0213]|nr:flagellar hook-associated protein 3 [Xanthomonadaceae bacterium NML91-0213]